MFSLVERLYFIEVIACINKNKAGHRLRRCFTKRNPEAKGADTILCKDGDLPAVQRCLEHRELAIAEKFCYLEWAKRYASFRTSSTDERLFSLSVYR